MTKPIANSKMQSEFVSDLELFYYTLGDKNNPPLVFLHGLLAFTEAYKRFFTYLLPENLEPDSLLQLLSTDYKFAVSFSILVIVLLFRPSGIFKGKTL